VLENPTPAQVEQYLPSSTSSLLAFDYETTGLEKSDRIVGVSIVDAANPGGVYFSFKNVAASFRSWVIGRIAARPSIAHNAQFEQWMTHTELGYHATVHYDTQALLNQLEGDWASFPGNKGLKNLQVELLGWETKGDVELDAWLVEAGLVNGRGKPLKGEMHRAPDYILGKYCNMDAQATWDLYQEVFKPVLHRFPELDLYLRRDFQNLIKLIDIGRREGMAIDRQSLHEHKSNLESRSWDLLFRFHEDSPATPYIKQYNASVVNSHYDKMPPKKTKGGKPSSRFANWKNKLERLQEDEHFNPNSKDQLSWLFYDCLFDTHVQSKTNRWGKTEQAVIIKDIGKVALTPSGKRSVDKKILPKLGKAGELLAEYNKINKELSYVAKMIERSEGGTHHTQLRVAGTKTDRCSGTGGLNIQQLPKSRGYLDCLVPRKGWKFIQMDVNALEPVVLAELSECPSYMGLYGPGMPPNDVYLFIAAKIPQFSKEIIDAGYEPERPTAEGIASAKKKCKRTRAICKQVHLAAGYGAGAAKIHEALTGQGVSISLAEVTDIRRMYWEVFEGVVNYRERITEEWNANKGFFLGGLGTPISVEAGYEKDILNRCIQTTGHQILARYLYHLTQLKPQAIPVVADFHDETIWQCEEKYVEKNLDIFNQAWYNTNKELGGIIPLAGDPEVHINFSGFKCE
jgi:DNA polymerase I-like protein with 3'-5' exonuclease and polymerase domains